MSCKHSIIKSLGDKDETAPAEPNWHTSKLNLATDIHHCVLSILRRPCSNRLAAMLSAFTPPRSMLEMSCRGVGIKVRHAFNTGPLQCRDHDYPLDWHDAFSLSTAICATLLHLWNVCVSPPILSLLKYVSSFLKETLKCCWHLFPTAIGIYGIAIHGGNELERRGPMATSITILSSPWGISTCYRNLILWMPEFHKDAFKCQTN